MRERHLCEVGLRESEREKRERERVREKREREREREERERERVKREMALLATFPDLT